MLYRSLDDTSLAGTLPAAVADLTSLTTLCALLLLKCSPASAFVCHVQNNIWRSCAASIEQGMCMIDTISSILLVMQWGQVDAMQEHV